MPWRRFRRTTVRTWEGLTLALAVPLAWVIVHDLWNGLSPLDDILANPALYGGLTASTAFAYGLFGYLVGLQEERLVRSNVVLERLSKTDKLTGLPNRRDFDDNLEREVSSADRTATPLALVIFDLDHFKRVNDEHGHLAGDALLRMIGATLIDGRRKQDFTARIGGEEFGMILPGLGLEQARLVAERCLYGVRQVAFYWNGRRITMTVSAGVAALTPKESPENLLARADAALYAAKNSGRDRVNAAGQVEKK